MALEGVRVLDLSRVLAGPYCSMMLGDMGADVVKVERPGKGDDTRTWGPPFVQGESAYYLSVNRNKRSLTLDFKTKRGREVLWRLAETCDVFLENFSPGTVAGLGFGYEEVRERNPSVIYCSISGFGQSGPSRDHTAYDLILQGVGGLMSLTGEEDGMPTRAGVPIADLTAGMMAAFAIVAALYHRERAGEGQYIDTSLLGGQVALLTYHAASYFATCRVPTRHGNRHPIVTPYDTFRTANGWVNVAAGNDSLWQRLCTVIQRDDVAQDPRFATNGDRAANREALYSEIEPAIARMRTEDILSRCRDLGVPCATVASVDQVMADEQVLHMGYRTAVQHPTIGLLDQAGMPSILSQTPATIRRHPPLLGEHTDEILGELGYGEEARNKMRRDGVV